MSNQPNPYLSELYGTVDTTPAQEDLEKQAQAELFLKLAEKEGVDLDALSNEQVSSLWEHVFGEKLASDDKDEDDKDGDKPSAPPFAKKDDKEGEEEKKAQAAREFEEQKAAQEELAQKMAEADYLGRVMAHSLHDELNKIAAAKEAFEEDGETKEARGINPMQAARNMAQFAGYAAKKAPEKARAAATGAAQKGRRLAFQAKEKGRAGFEAAKKHVGEHKGKYIAGGTIAGGTAGGAAAGAMTGRKKEGSALDELAAQHAVKIAEDAGYDVEQAAQRIGAVFVLGAGESEKVASATNFEQAVEIRSLEMLEAAGYPVTWEQPAE